MQYCSSNGRSFSYKQLRRMLQSRCRHRRRRRSRLAMAPAITINHEADGEVLRMQPAAAVRLPVRLPVAC